MGHRQDAARLAGADPAGQRLHLQRGVIYYRATKQRVRLPITAELESWVRENIAEAKRVITGPIPAPLVDSPKCVRCSLAPVCLPDETRMLAQPPLRSRIRGPGTTAGKGSGERPAAG